MIRFLGECVLAVVLIGGLYQSQYSKDHQTIPSNYGVIDSYLVLDKQEMNIRIQWELLTFEEVYAYRLREGVEGSLTDGVYVVGIRKNGDRVWIVDADFEESHIPNGKVNAISYVEKVAWFDALGRAKRKGYDHPSARDLFPKIYTSARAEKQTGNDHTPRQGKRLAKE